MQAWLGHYVDNRKAWYIVWADSAQEAAMLIDGVSGEPHIDSMRPVSGPGFIDLAVATGLDGADGLEIHQGEDDVLHLDDDDLRRIEREADR